MKKTFIFITMLLCFAFSAIAKTFPVQDFVSEQGYPFLQFNRTQRPDKISAFEGETTLNFYVWNNKTGVWDFIKEIEFDGTKGYIEINYSQVFGTAKATVIESTNKDFEIYIANSTRCVNFKKNAEKLRREDEERKARSEAELAQRLAELEEREEKKNTKGKELSKGYIYIMA